MLRAKHLRSTFHIFLVNAFAGAYFKETDSDYGTSSFSSWIVLASVLLKDLVVRQQQRASRKNAGASGS